MEQQYELTAFDRKYKIEVNNYYTTYIRNQAEKLNLLTNAPQKMASDYDLGSGKLMCKDIRFKEPELCKIVKQVTEQCFLPLTPAQMSKILITPDIFYTGPVSKYFRI